MTSTEKMSLQEEALAFAEQGSKVAVFAGTLDLAQVFFAGFESILNEDEVKKIIRLNGARAIHFHSGGLIRFHSTRSVPRGYFFDRVYVPAGIQHNVMEQLAPLVVTSREPAIVGYF